MIRKSILLIVILAMLLSCRAVTGQPASTPPTPSSVNPMESPEQVIQPTPRPLATPVPLAAELTSDRDLHRFLPTTPIRIRFNQSMDPESSSLAIITYPWVEGKLRWEAENTQLIFEPSAGYRPEQRYQVFLNQMFLPLKELMISLERNQFVFLETFCPY